MALNLSAAARCTAEVEHARARALTLLERAAPTNGHSVFMAPREVLSELREAAAVLTAASEAANRIVWPTSEDYEALRTRRRA
jgi:hypothetical protein